MSEPDEHYLGDGLYAHFDGFSVWLRAPREGGDHYVALEPWVLSEFMRWLERLRAAGRVSEPKQ